MGNLRLIAAAVFACATGQAAAGVAVRSEYSANVSLVRPTHLAKGAVSSVGVPGNPAANAVTLRGATTFPGPLGTTVSGTVGTSLSLRSAATVGARLLPAVGVAALIASAYLDLRVAPVDGELKFDEGADRVPQVAWVYRARMHNNLFSDWIYSSHNSAANAVFMSAQAAGCGANCAVTRFSTVAPPPGVNGSVNIFARIASGPEFLYYSRPIESRQETQLVCPLVSGPSGSYRPEVDYDGKCPTGEFTADITPEEAAARATDPAAPLISPTAWKEMLDDALNRSSAPVAIPAGNPAFVENPVPAMVPGPTSTTVDDTGTTTVETGFYGIPSTAADAARVRWTERRTTTKTDPNGNPIGGPKVEETTPPDADPAPEPDACREDPSRLGCAGFGDPPDDMPQWDERAVNLASENLGLPSGCPAPHVMAIRGWDVSLNYQPACDVAPLVRAGILALTALACLLFILRETRA